MTTRSAFLYLTFDDGPTLHTTEVLEILARHEFPATFFVVGNRVAEYGDILSSVYAAGHTVGNHSYSYQKSTNLDYNALEDMDGCARLYHTVGARPLRVLKSIEVVTRE